MILLDLCNLNFDNELRQAHADAVTWFQEIVNQIDFAEVREKLIENK